LTIRDAALYITKLPKAEHDAPEWQRVSSTPRNDDRNSQREIHHETTPASTQGTNTKKMAVPMTAAVLRMDTSVPCYSRRSAPGASQVGLGSFLEIMRAVRDVRFAPMK
jgi:hypothetical protein